MMPTQSESIHPQTRIGAVSLRVSDLRRSIQFYEGILGFQSRQRDKGTVALGAQGGADIIELVEDSGARPAVGKTGLYHMAIRVPTRLELARVMRHLIESGWPLQGASDHRVSEALYLSDPERNGIEIYRDRPRSEWPYQNGQLQMATDPLDVDGILSLVEGESEPYRGMPSGTVMGHVHLKVADITAAEAFYCGVLGFDLVTHYGKMAGFVSAGGYHHHIGFNIWESAGASPPPPGSTGLRYFTICLPERSELDRVIARIREHELPLEETPQGYLTSDPSQNGVMLSTSQDSKNC